MSQDRHLGRQLTACETADVVEVLVPDEGQPTKGSERCPWILETGQDRSPGLFVVCAARESNPQPAGWESRDQSCVAFRFGAGQRRYADFLIMACDRSTWFELGHKRRPKRQIDHVLRLEVNRRRPAGQSGPHRRRRDAVMR
jgi:hypothetical protein